MIDPREGVARHKPRCPTKYERLEYGWLCASCAGYLTIQIDEEFAPRVVRKLEAKNDSKFDTTVRGTHVDIA